MDLRPCFLSDRIACQQCQPWRNCRRRRCLTRCATGDTDQLLGHTPAPTPPQTHLSLTITLRNLQLASLRQTLDSGGLGNRLNADFHIWRSLDRDSEDLGSRAAHGRSLGLCGRTPVVLGERQAERCQYGIGQLKHTPLTSTDPFAALKNGI